MIGNISNRCTKNNFFVSGAILAIAVLIVVLAVPGTSVAQVLYGTIVGNVKDPSGAAIPGATITVTETETQLTRKVTTDASGNYRASTLAAGNYNLKVEAKGFQTFLRNEIPVTINTVTRVNASLTVGSVTQQVQVTGSAPVLQTDAPKVSHDLSSREIVDAPLPPGRNFQQLVRVVPGFNPPSDAHSIPSNPSRSLAFNSNGTSQYGNDTKIDGVSQYNIWLPENAAYIPSADAIQTVNIATNTFDPEQGLAGGSTTNVEIRSGTNNFHGDAYEYHTDNALQARNFFDPGRKPKSVFNQFGVSVGGPIKKNKLFYFGNYEGTRQRDFASTLTSMATVAMRNGDLTGAPYPIYDPATGNLDGTGRTQIYATNNPADTAHYNALCNAAQCMNMIPTSRISPVASTLLSMQQTPTPSLVGNGLTDNYYATGGFVFNRHTVDGKVNWNATPKFTMYGHLGLLFYNGVFPTLWGSPLTGGTIEGGNPGIGDGRTISISTTGNYVASPNFVVDANFGMTRMVTNARGLATDTTPGIDLLGIPGTNGTRNFEGGFPRFDLDHFADLGIDAPFMPYFRNDPQFHYGANASWIHGNHTIRFGGDIFTLHLNQQQPEFAGSNYGPQGGFAFRSGPTALNTGGGVASNTSSEYNSFATFLLGIDTQLGKNIQVPDYFHTITNNYDLYVGDTWQTTHKLTTTVGLRWEYYPMPTRGGSRGMERYDPSTNMMLICGEGSIPTNCGTQVSKKLFSPRIGFAYRATDTFVIRAGFGVATEPYNTADGLRTNYPILIPLAIDGPNSFAPAGVLNAQDYQNVLPAQQAGGANEIPVGIPLPPLPNVTSGSVPLPGTIQTASTGDQLHRGYVESWNFTLEKEVAHGWVAQAGYVATRSVRQLGALNLNVGNPDYCYTTSSGPACGGQASEPFNILYGRTAGTYLITPIANNHYDSLQATLNHRWASGYLMKLAYTWSKTIGMNGANHEKSGLSISTPNYIYLNRGLSDLDRPQNFEAIFQAQSPFGSGKQWMSTGLGSKVLGGWMVSGIVSAISGSVFDVTADGNSLNAPGNTQRANILKSNVAISGNVGTGTTWFDTSAFAPVTAPYTFGTAPFNVLHGPGIFDFDFGLYRTFKLSERFSLQFQAQSFNFTNTPHFSNPDGNANSSTFGRVHGTTNLAREGLDGRQFQFGMRISF